MCSLRGGGPGPVTIRRHANRFRRVTKLANQLLHLLQRERRMERVGEEFGLAERGFGGVDPRDAIEFGFIVDDASKIILRESIETASHPSCEKVRSGVDRR